MNRKIVSWMTVPLVSMALGCGYTPSDDSVHDDRKTEVAYYKGSTGTDALLHKIYDPPASLQGDIIHWKKRIDKLNPDLQQRIDAAKPGERICVAFHNSTFEVVFHPGTETCPTPVPTAYR